MFRAAIDLELVEQATPQPIFRQHPVNGHFDHPLGTRLQELACGGAAYAARKAGVPMINLVGQFLAGQLYLGRIDDDDEVAGVLIGREIRAMLPPQNARGARCNPAEGAPFGVDHHPMTSAQRAFVRDASSLFGQLQVRYPFAVVARYFICAPLEALKLAGPMGFEPTTSDVTGRRSNRA